MFLNLLNKKKCLVVCFALACSLNAYLDAQTPCMTDVKHLELLKSSHEYKNNYEDIQQAIYNYSIDYYSRPQSRSKLLYTIPVVIHLIVPPGVPIGSSYNLNDAELERGLNYLNQSFANQGIFKNALGVDCEIQFCLAVRDPNGMPTNGITRTESILVADAMPCSPYGTNSANDAQIKSLVNWDCRNYLNIWLVTDLYNTGFGCGLAGYAYFPGAPCTVDGIVQEARYWNSVGGAGVTVHEVGHYFSLNHTFNGGCINVNCLTDGDQVCDTPPDNSPSFAACNTNSCNSDNPDLPDDNSNYMDYTSCTPPHFTNGQKLRMIAGLESGRKSLLQSQACVPVINLDGAILSIDLPTPVCDPNICPKVTWKNNGLNTLSNVRFRYQFDNNALQNYDWNGNLIPNTITNFTLPCLKLIPGNHTVKIYIESLNANLDGYTRNDTQSLQFIIFPQPIIALNKITGTHCISDGTATVSATKGLAPYVYQLSPLQYFQSNSIFSLLSANNYTAIVTDANGCKDSIPVIIPDSCTTSVPKKFITNSDAIYQGNDCYRLTDAIGGQVGSIWYDQLISLDQSFDVVFDINLGCIDGNGADGIAFMLQPLSTTIGTSGGGLGYAGVKPSLVIEFDTYQNCCSQQSSNTAQDGNDPIQDHMAIMRDGTVNHLHTNNLAGPVDIINGTNAEDCRFHNVRISWNAVTKTISCFFDCNRKLVYTGDVVKNIFSNNPNVYFGFTAATGGSINVQQVCFKYISFLDKLKDQTICRGSNIQIAADDDFDSYQWTPSTGLSNPNLRNPIFSPDVTTQYIVTMKDLCGFTVQDTVIVNVINLNLDYKIKYKNPCSASLLSDIYVETTPALPGILYAIDGVNYSPVDSFVNLPTGAYVISARIGNCIQSKLIHLNQTKPLSDSLIYSQAERCNQKGVIYLAALGGYPSYEYKINSMAWQTTGYFNNLDSGRYTIAIRDSLGCEITIDFYLAFLKQKLALDIINSDLDVACSDTATFINLLTSGTSPVYQFVLDKDRINNTGNYTGLSIGKHNIFSRDEFGCSSDTLTFDVINKINHKLENKFVSICPDEFYIVGNKKYSLPGKYIDTLLTVESCDSTIITNLSYFPVHVQNLQKAICDGDFFQVGKKKYTLQNNYSDTLSNIYHCDSIINLDLIVHPLNRPMTDVQICDGDFYRVGTSKYFNAGTYVDTIADQFQCDSIITTRLRLNPVYALDNVREICEDGFITVGNKNYNLDGQYIDTLQSQFGCDSVIQTELTVYPILKTYLKKEICDGDFYRVGQTNYDRTGVSVDTLFDQFRCDSIVTLDLLVNPNTRQEIAQTTCENQAITINKETYKYSGRYTQHLDNYKGCDSTLLIDLEVIDTHIVLREFILCDGDSFHVGNKYYRIAGKFTDVLPSIYGCDSTVHSNVLVGDDFYCDSLHCRVYIPNVFTPNGDQINDNFQFFSPVLTINYLAIYDRWGGLIYESKSLDPQWDGRNQQGELLNPGVFVYLMRAVCSNGKQVKKYGEITLIR